MKKESASRRKKLPLLLGALLIISVAAYGTRAYFSDSAQMQGNIELSLGDVDITTTDESGWTYQPVSASTTNPEQNLNLSSGTKIGEIIPNGTKLTNVRPGDSFTKKYTIKNNGSLDVKLDLVAKKQNHKITAKEYPYGAYTITIDDILGTDTVLIPEDTKDINITIAVKEDIDNSTYNVKDTPEKTVANFLNEFLTVEAVQSNVNNK